MNEQNQATRLELDIWNPAGPRWDVKKIGWRFASTFPGFCDKHDNLAFAPLEKEQFVGRPDQCFLLGYRATCHELQQKTAVAAAQRQNAALLAHFHGRTPPVHREYWANAVEAKENLVLKKARLDALFLARDWSNWRSHVFYFRGTPAVVAAGSTSPEYDLNGRRLQDCTDPKCVLETLSVGVVDCGDRFAYVLGWEPGHDRAEAFVDSLVAQRADRLPGLFVQYLFLQLQNVFFSDEWWESLSGSEKAVLARHAAVLIETEKPQLSRARFVDWTLAEENGRRA